EEIEAELPQPTAHPSRRALQALLRMRPLLAILMVRSVASFARHPDPGEPPTAASRRMKGDGLRIRARVSNHRIAFTPYPSLAKGAAAFPSSALVTAVFRSLWLVMRG